MAGCRFWGFEVVVPEDCPLIGGSQCLCDCEYFKGMEGIESIEEDDDD